MFKGNSRGSFFTQSGESVEQSASTHGGSGVNFNVEEKFE